MEQNKQKNLENKIKKTDIPNAPCNHLNSKLEKSMDVVGHAIDILSYGAAFGALGGIGTLMIFNGAEHPSSYFKCLAFIPTAITFGVGAFAGYFNGGYSHLE